MKPELGRSLEHIMKMPPKLSQGDAKSRRESSGVEIEELCKIVRLIQSPQFRLNPEAAPGMLIDGWLFEGHKRERRVE